MKSELLLVRITPVMPVEALICINHQSANQPWIKLPYTLNKMIVAQQNKSISNLSQMFLCPACRLTLAVKPISNYRRSFEVSNLSVLTAVRAADDKFQWVQSGARNYRWTKAQQTNMVRAVINGQKPRWYWWEHPGVEEISQKFIMPIFVGDNLILISYWLASCNRHNSCHNHTSLVLLHSLSIPTPIPLFQYQSSWF